MLHEHPRVGTRVRPMTTVDLRHHRVEVAAAGRGRRRQELDILGKERHDRERADDVVRPPGRAVRGVPPRPLAGGDLRGEQRDLQTGTLVLPVARLDNDSGERCTPADHLGVVAGTR